MTNVLFYIALLFSTVAIAEVGTGYAAADNSLNPVSLACLEDNAEPAGTDSDELPYLATNALAVSDAASAGAGCRFPPARSNHAIAYRFIRAPPR